MNKSNEKELINEILKRQRIDITILFDDYKIEIENHFNELTNEINTLKQNIKEKDDKIIKLTDDIKDNDFNNQNYQNFSLVSNLSKQIREKEIELKTCQSQLRLAKKEIDNLKEKLDLISEKDELMSNVSLYIEEQSNINSLKNIEHHKEEEIVEATNEVVKEEVVKEVVEATKKLVEEEVEEEEEEDDEEEVSYIKKKIKGKYYFISDENPPQIYEYLEDNEVGSLLGKMNDKKAEFY
jgi:hypothetical protein